MNQSTSLRVRRWLAVLSLAVGVVLVARAESVEINGLYYELNTTNRTATLTYQNTTTSNYASLPASVTVPENVTYNGVSFSVTTIADKAFANCTALESISIPATVTKLGNTNSNTYSEATYLPFYNCTSLKIVRFEDGALPIKLVANYYNNSSYAKGLFYYAPLEEVYIGRNITYSDYSSGTPFANRPEYYGYSAFYNQPKLTKVTIGATVTDIPAYLFYNCTALASVEFGTSLNSIPKYAFKSCALKSIELPNTVLSIAEYAFDSNSQLESVNIGNSAQTIGDYAFNNCALLSDIKLGQTLKAIGKYAFASSGKNSTNWSSLNLPETLTTIGEYAFSSSGCPSITVPNAVTSIGVNAFASNAKLQSITFGAGCTILPESILSGCSALTKLNLSEGIETISDKAFANCTALESISIPATVTKLGNTNSNTYSEATYLPFYNCTSLKIVRFEDGALPIKLAANYYNNSSYAKGLFYYAPLEEVYIGRNITYSDYSSGTPFANRPEYYGYSAFYNQPKLTKVTIGETVTDIPAYLFYNNASITLMTLPNVKSIGDAAFKQCSKLTTLNLGQSLMTVGNEAFYGCTNVTKLTFPNTTQSIGNRAFYNCSSVTEVTVGTGLKSIGANGFYGCKSFTALILPDTFTTMGESAFEGCTKLTVAKLGTSLTAVPARAFKNCPSLSEMVIPASAKSLGDQALYNDSGLATITMNEGLETIGNEVFWNNSGVMQFSIPGTVTSMGTNCFYGCTRATYLTFRDGDETLAINNSGTRSSVIDQKTTDSSCRNRRYDYFYDCPIRFLTLGRNLTYSYSDNVSMYDLNGTSFKNISRASAPFVNSKELRSVTIGPKVTFLYHHLFDGCASLATLKKGQNIETIYTYAFKNCDKLASVDFPESLKLIDDYAFFNCDILQSTTYQESADHTLTIDNSAFRESPELTSVTFPGQLTKLGAYSFKDCNKLHTTVFNNTTIRNNNLEINDYTFSNCSVLKTVKFPSHLYKIYNYVYESCPSLNELSFPGSLISMGNYVFKNTAYLTDIRFEDSFSAVTLGYGAASSNGTDSQSLPLFGNSNLQSLYLGRNIEYNATSNYGYSPFYNQQWLTDVRFSQSGHVTYCKDYLLYAVNNCKELVLPESLKTIGSRTFASMTVLKGITIPNQVTEIGTYAFSDDDGLKYAHLSTSCPWLKEGLFNSCDSLESITIPPVVTKMDTKMFANCKSLASATFDGSSDVLEMGYGASLADYGLFRDCPLETLNLDRWLSYNTAVASRSPFYSIAALKNLTLGENVGVVDKYMFSYCTGLEEVYLPDNIESVGLWGFRGCTSLKTVRFSEKLSQVSDYGFSECSSLDNVVFPESMTSIADNSFSNCKSLKKLNLGNSLMIIGPAAFKNDTSLEGIDIPETLYGLGVEAFANCTSLPNVAIKAITSVGRQAFEGCSGLQWVSLSDKTTSLGENSFAGCSEIKYIKSYAEFPPEGLVNFVESVPANGTLFVPENSIDYYQYSPTWENWYSIRPLNDNIMVSSVELDKSEVSFKATETIQLTATVGADDASDKGILWRTSAESIASVDENGLVTAVAVGNATITALAADGSGVKAECNVIVNPTLVESIIIKGDVTSLKKGRTLELLTNVLPATATNNNVVWTSSDARIASVDADGIVTANLAGEVEITATAEDGSGVSKTYVLSVIPPTKGDSNDNDIVTITDAVNTANYAVGNEVDNFCFEAADVNGDNKVTLADASGTVTVLLDMPEMNAAAKSCARLLTVDAEQDLLIVDDYSSNVGETASISITLDNSYDYVAMQADVVLPEGMSLISIEAGDRAANHTLMTKQVNANTTRIVLFDFDRGTFADNDGSLFRLNVKVSSEATGDIIINNALASDSKANEYVLQTTGGHNFGMSGVKDVNYGTVKVMAENSVINILNVLDHEIAVYAIDGTMLAHRIAKSDNVCIRVVSGVYVVTVADYVTKVVVK